MTNLTTARVVAILRAAGLVAAQDGRPGFTVRRIGRTLAATQRRIAPEIGVASNTLTAEAWSVAMGALTAAGLDFTYRCDAGMGARVRPAVAR